MTALSNEELTKKYILIEIRLRWLIRKLQDKNIITEEEFQEIWNSWENDKK